MYRLSNLYKIINRVPMTINLSATGSRNFPKFVTRLFFLAIFPSSISVTDAIINMNAQTVEEIKK